MPRAKKVLTVDEILDKIKELREKEVALIMMLADGAHAVETFVGWTRGARVQVENSKPAKRKVARLDPRTVPTDNMPDGDKGKEDNV